MKFFKNNFTVKFVVSLFLISVVFGLLFYFAYKPDLSAHIEEFKSLIITSKQNTFLLNLSIISIIFILSISVIGIPIILFYIFYEGFSIGFTLGLFLYFYKIKGFFFYIIFILCSKLFYIFLVLYFCTMCIKFILRLIEAVIHKDKDNLYRCVIVHFYRYILILLIIIINCTLIYFFSNNVLKLILNLI